jgi:TPR repeat protein
MAALALAPAAYAQRIALVIGNAAYADKPLRNPVNDATDVAAELRKAGFNVKRHTDLSRRGMIDALRQFTTQAQAAQLAVVYYSGHGMQSAGENYLIPTDARINDEKDVRSEGMALRDLLGDLDDAKVQKTVVILDACRDNPYQTRSKGTKKGLARVETGGNATVVAFATADGKTADDGTGRNGVYTTALLGQLRRAPQDIRDLLDETANAVVRQTQDQKPKIYGDTGAFKGVYLAGRGVQVASASAEPTGRPVQSDPEEETWQAAKAANTAAAYDAYLGEYPRGRYASAARIAKVAMQPRFSTAELASSSSEAHQKYYQAAMQGDVVSQFNLGVSYDNGTGGLGKDQSEAIKWYRKAAEQGFATAQVSVGDYYNFGFGSLNRDEVEAHKWYRKAADQGHATAQFNMGVSYDNGTGGLGKDQSEAIKWFRKAADQGLAVSQNKVGDFYNFGFGGLGKDEVEAYKWYRKAADQGLAIAQFNIGVKYDNGTGGLAKDQSEAIKWLRKAAEQGHVVAQARVGNYYSFGHGGLNKDEVEAIKWYRKAADQGLAIAQYNMGVNYVNGTGGLVKDEAEAIKWYRKAAAQGNANAVAQLKGLGLQ